MCPYIHINNCFLYRSLEDNFGKGYAQGPILVDTGSATEETAAEHPVPDRADNTESPALDERTPPEAMEAREPPQPTGDDLQARFDRLDRLEELCLLFLRRDPPAPA